MTAVKTPEEATRLLGETWDAIVFDVVLEHGVVLQHLDPFRRRRCAFWTGVLPALVDSGESWPIFGKSVDETHALLDWV